jgi:hypothetical protein
VEEVALREPDDTEVEVVSVSSDEPSNMAEVAQSSHTEGPTTIMWVGHSPYQWGLCLTWSDRNQPEAPLIFVLDDAEEQGYKDRLQAGCQSFNKTLSLALSTLHDDICLAGQVCRVR